MDFKNVHQHVWTLPFRPNGTGPDVSVLKIRPGDLLKMEVPVGNIPTRDIPEYMKQIRKTFHESCTNRIKADMVWLPVRADGSKIAIKKA